MNPTFLTLPVVTANTSFNIADLQAVINVFGHTFLEVYLKGKTKGLVIKSLFVLDSVGKAERHWKDSFI